MPTRAIQESRRQPHGLTRRPPANVQEITDEIEREMIVDGATGGDLETIKHAVRRRFELAVRRTLEQMRGRVWRYRDPTDIMTRIANERLLIADERYRTPLRKIAREAGVSSGRACDYEKNLLKAVRATFEQDPQLRLLVEMAQEENAGWNALMNAERRQRLIQADLREFEARFTALEPPARAEMIYSLIEKSSQCVPEVARNLFRLTMTMEDDAVRTVA